MYNFREKLRIFYFNSIKVRLERSLVSRGVRSSSRFQFHKGAIRTLVLLHPLIEMLEFQFHKGAIRTVHHYLLAHAVLHFNSIKVRLEHFLGCYDIDPETNFNSIKVRLELRASSASLRASSYFNSIKVRLERSRCSLRLSLTR